MGKQLKRGIVVCLMIVLGLSAAPQPAKASDQDVLVMLDGQQLNFDVKPQLLQNRTFVPFRALLEAMGASVWWDPTNSTAYAEKDGVTIRMPIGSDRIFRNDSPIQMDATIQLVHDRTMIPLRFVSEALGADVTWKEAASTSPFTVTVKTKAVSVTGTPASIRVLNGDGKVSPQTVHTVESLVKSAKISEKISGDFGLPFTQPVRIYLAADSAGYRQILLSHAASGTEVDQLVQASAGIAYGNDIFIPVSDSNADKDLKNIIAHELTHVLLYQNGAGKMPSWINEGLAWREALKAEFEGYANVVYKGRKSELRNSILDAKQAGKLIGLLHDPKDTISVKPGYNVEIQDWLAVDYLINQYGFDKLFDYLSRVKRGDAEPFTRAFGVTEQNFEKNFTACLDSLLSRTDKGVKVSFKVAKPFAGDFLLTPKGKTNWRSFALEPSEYTILIDPDGTVSGINGTGLTQSTGSPENDVVYIGVVPGQDTKDHDKTVHVAGFAIKYGHGDYYLLNGWKTYTDHTTDYPETNFLYGVEIDNIEPL